jgi:hypothetical protein
MSSQVRYVFDTNVIVSFIYIHLNRIIREQQANLIPLADSQAHLSPPQSTAHSCAWL